MILQRRGVFGPGGFAPVNSIDWTSSTAIPAWATFTATGLATQFDSTGKLTYRPNNLLTYSNTFSNAAWTKTNATVASGVADPFGGTNASTITATAANGTITQSYALTSANSYNGINTVWLRRRTGSGTVNFYGPAAISAVPVTLTASWQQFQLKTVGNADGHFYFYVIIATNGDAIDMYAPTTAMVTYESPSASYDTTTYLTAPRQGDQVITTSAAYYGPRFDYTYNGSAWVSAGLMVEGAATNLLNQSNDLATVAWSGSVVTVTDNQATGPDGQTSLAKLQNNSAGANPQRYQLGKTTTNSAYVGSAYLRAGNLTWIILNMYDGVDHRAWVNLSTGAVGTTPVGSTIKVDNLGGGLWRVQHTRTMGAFANSGLSIELADGDNVMNVASTSSYHYAGFAQFEVGSSASSYTPTGAAAVTRAAETVQLTGTALTAALGSAATAFLEVGGLPTQNTATRYLQYGAGSGLLISMSSGSSTILYEQNTAGSASTTATAGSGSITTVLRAGVAWGSVGGRKLVANGGSLGVDASNSELATAPVNIGQGQGTYINGYLRSFAIYTSRLPDATLQSKSVVGASY